MSEDSKHLYCVKMRASKGEKHISGAENIVPEDALDTFASALLHRAENHPNGKPDFINLKIEAVTRENIVSFDALKVSTVDVPDADTGLAKMTDLLEQSGIRRAKEIVAMLRECHGMRGAILLNAATLERLEPDHVRGVRATRMDAAESAQRGASPGKNHFAEAIVLATKVVHTPHIAAELCISDDPDYVTGYFASKSAGYVRITKLKAPGSSFGGRIFLFNGTPDEVPETIAFLERQCVLIRNAPQTPVPLPLPAAKHLNRMERLSHELDDLKEHALFRDLRVYETAPGPHAVCNGHPYLMLASNNYLDLANDPRVKHAAAEAAERYGAGSGGARLLTGTLPPHAELEERLAAFKGTESAIVFGTGYQANCGTVSALCGKGGTVFSDELNHASIIDGCRLARANVVVYRHNDMDDLEEKIRRTPHESGLIVSDAVFSMDGDIVNLPRLLDLAEKYDLFSMTDEAHATGVAGLRGHGVCEHFHLAHGPDVLMGTLSKALGAEGGFVCGTRTLIEYLRNKARSFIFTTAPCPASMAAANAALDILDSEPERVAALRENVAFFTGELHSRGVEAFSESAIVPIRVGSEEKALAVSRALFERGIVLPAIRYPTVRKGEARLRAALMSSHTKEDLRTAADAIAELLSGGSFS